MSEFRMVRDLQQGGCAFQGGSKLRRWLLTQGHLNGLPKELANSDTQIIE